MPVEARRPARTSSSSARTRCTRSRTPFEKEVDLPLLHIGDTTAGGDRAAGVRGWACSAPASRWRSRLRRPAARRRARRTGAVRADQAIVHRVIYDELCLGVIRDERGDYRRRDSQPGRRRCRGRDLRLHRDRAARRPEDSPVPTFPHDAAARRSWGRAGAGLISGCGGNPPCRCAVNRADAGCKSAISQQATRATSNCPVLHALIPEETCDQHGQSSRYSFSAQPPAREAPSQPPPRTRSHISRPGWPRDRCCRRRRSAPARRRRARSSPRRTASTRRRTAFQLRRPGRCSTASRCRASARSIPAGHGQWWALADNGYGTRDTSADWQLPIYRMDLGLGDRAQRRSVVETVLLSDPNHYVPWKTVCDPTVGTDLPPFTFNVLPTSKPAACGTDPARGCSRDSTSTPSRSRSTGRARSGSVTSSARSCCTSTATAGCSRRRSRRPASSRRRTRR